MSDAALRENAWSERMRRHEAAAILPGDVVRALDWLRAHLGEPVDLETLAQVAGVPPRTLESHFRQFLGTTPLGWVRQARLALARRKLLQAGPQDSVTAVALSSGFSQLGRFAAQYRQRFGELPSETLRRVRGAPNSGFDANDDEAARLTWQALPCAFAVAPDRCDVALEALAQARELAPDYALAKALSAWCWGQRAAHHFSSTKEADRARSRQLAEEAAAAAPDDAMAQSLVSGAMVLAHRLEDADRFGTQALALDPWSPFAWIRRGWMSAYLGDGDTAIRELGTMLHLMPFEPLRHLAFIGIGCAHFAEGRYEQAARWGRAGVDAYPGSFWAARIVAGAAAHAGARAEARRVVRSILRKDPNLTVSEAYRAWPFPPDFNSRLADGLAMAGLPRL
jgi:AraC-like DNA-binding protein